MDASLIEELITRNKPRFNKSASVGNKGAQIREPS